GSRGGLPRGRRRRGGGAHEPLERRHDRRRLLVRRRRRDQVHPRRAARRAVLVAHVPVCAHRPVYVAGSRLAVVRRRRGRLELCTPARLAPPGGALARARPPSWARAAAGPTVFGTLIHCTRCPRRSRARRSPITSSPSCARRTSP